MRESFWKLFLYTHIFVLVHSEAVEKTSCNSSAMRACDNSLIEKVLGLCNNTSWLSL